MLAQGQQRQVVIKAVQRVVGALKKKMCPDQHQPGTAIGSIASSAPGLRAARGARVFSSRGAEEYQQRAKESSARCHLEVLTKPSPTLAIDEAQQS